MANLEQQIYLQGRLQALDLWEKERYLLLKGENRGICLVGEEKAVVIKALRSLYKNNNQRTMEITDIIGKGRDFEPPFPQTQALGNRR